MSLNSQARARLLAAAIAAPLFQLMAATAAVSGRQPPRRLSTGSLEQGFGSRGPSGKSGGPGHFVLSELNGLKFTIGHLCNIMTTQLRLSYHIHILGRWGLYNERAVPCLFFLVCFPPKNKVRLRV